MPPKRKASQPQSRKRVRTEESTARQPGLNIGAPTEDDSPSAQRPTSSSSSSTRVVPPFHVPALTTLSARVFVANLRKLSEDEARWRKIQRWIDAVPDAIVPNLFAMLRTSWPRLLNDALISHVSCYLLFFSKPAPCAETRAGTALPPRTCHRVNERPDRCQVDHNKRR